MFVVCTKSWTQLTEDIKYSECVKFIDDQVINGHDRADFDIAMCVMILKDGKPLWRSWK